MTDDCSDPRSASALPTTYYGYHDPGDSGRISTTVANTLADAMGIEAAETGFSIHDSVDSGALNRLFAPHPDGTLRSPGHVMFHVQGYRVTVYSTGQIVVAPPDRRPAEE